MFNTLLTLFIVDILIGIIFAIYILRKYFTQSSQHYGEKRITLNDRLLVVVWISFSFSITVATFLFL